MISITNPTGRNTECRAVHIGDTTLFFSYETLIGFDTLNEEDEIVAFRVSNAWGPTTGRHFNDCGLKHATECHATSELQQAAMQALAKDIALETEILNDCFNQKEN